MMRPTRLTSLAPFGLIASIAVACSSTSPDAPELGAHVTGDSLVLDVDPDDGLRYLTCDYDFFLVEKVVADEWVALQDDRPGSYYQPCSFTGYYLDGEFVEPCWRADCDLVQCEPLPDGAIVGQALEYADTGVQRPPADYVYPGVTGGPVTLERPETVPVIETRPVHGLVRTHVRVFTDAACRSVHESTIELTVP